MCLFTYSKQLDVKNTSRYYIYDTESKLYKNIYKLDEKHNDPMLEELLGEDAKQIKQRDLRRVFMGLNRYYDEGHLPYVYAKLYLDGQEVVHSGHIIENWDEYIDLEKCFTKHKDELLHFIKMMCYRGIPARKFRVIGYIDSKSGEVFPQKIEVYTDSFMGFQESEQEVSQEAVPVDENNDCTDKQKIEQVIEFDELKATSNMVPYDKEGDWIEYMGTVYAGHISRRYLYRLSEVERRIDEWKENKKINGEWLEGILHDDYISKRTIKYQGKEYELVLGGTYYSLEAAIDQLKSVYLFAFIVILIMSIILAYSLWKNEQKARELEENRKRLVDAIGHELKTPLAVLRAYSEGLRDNIVEEKRTHYLQVIMDEVDRMNELIVKMLTLSKMESEAYVLKRKCFCLNDLVYQVIQNQQALIDKKELRLQIDEIEKIKISADCKSIEYVISNLLSNAVRHTTNKGKIYIHISSGLFSIENEGQPIKEEHQSSIWTPFFKGEEGDNRTGEGTGLGLAIVRQILNQHHIKHGVCNTDIGVKFWFEIKSVL